MSATIGAALKKIAVALLTDKKVIKTIGGIVIGIIIIVVEKSVDALYAKYVPANVREFIDMKDSQVKTPKPKKPKPQEENTEVAT